MPTLKQVPLAVACLMWMEPTRVVDGATLDVGTMSFNIRLSKVGDGPNAWEHRCKLVCQTIAQANCDFVGIQEAWPDQIAHLRVALPELHCLARSRDANPAGGEANPLLYRHERWRLDAKQHGTFWLSYTPDVPGSTTWWNICPRIVTWARFVEKKTGGAVYVYNTHFSHLSEPARRISAQVLAQRISRRSTQDPVIVTGDFNAGETSAAVRYLKGEIPRSPLRLIDTFRTVHPQATQAGTYNGFRGNTDGAKIDYILTLPSATVLHAAILRKCEDDRYPSDHFPVVARLRLPHNSENCQPD